MGQASLPATGVPAFEALAPPFSRVAMLAQKTSHELRNHSHSVPLILIFKIYSSFYINNLILKNPEVGDATLYNTNRVCVRGSSNHANSGVRPVLAKKNQIKRNTPVGDVAAGKWLEPPAKGQEGDAISCKTARRKVMYITYINHKSLILMHITEIPAAPKGRKTSIP